MTIKYHNLHHSSKTGRHRLHPAWTSFIGFCADLRFGEIEKLKIQDGLPMIAEKVKKKIHFNKDTANGIKP